MKKECSINFRFQDKNFIYKDEKKVERSCIAYQAKYYLGDKLKISILSKYEGSKLEKALWSLPPSNLIDKVKKTTQTFKDKCHDKIFLRTIFCQHATFEEIINSISPPYEDKSIFNELNEPSFAKKNKWEKQALEIIRDNPDMLLNKKDNSDIFCVSQLVHIMRTARWDVDKSKRDDATILLKDHLLPIRVGGKIPIPPRNHLKTLKNLLLKLAKYLKIIAKCNLKECDKEEEAVYLSERLASYKDKRLSRLSSKDLKSLITTPATFIDSRLQNHFKISKQKLKTYLSKNYKG